MMKRLILFALAVYCAFASTTNADEYLLRVDTIGYVDKPVAEKDPKETTLCSVEVVARPETTFHTKVDTGTQTLIVAGKLRPADDGRFDVQIRYVYSIDTGTTVPTKDGGRKSVPDTSEIQTNIAIGVGESVTLGGCETSFPRASWRSLPSRHCALG